MCATSVIWTMETSRFHCKGHGCFCICGKPFDSPKDHRKMVRRPWDYIPAMPIRIMIHQVFLNLTVHDNAVIGYIY
jgi:hypothetical protein